jgi:antitoxin PrlF
MYSYFMNRTRVSERGQVTIPKGLRDRLGIEPGSVLEFDAEGGRLVGRKAGARDPVDAVYGVIDLPRGTDEALSRLRGKADAV